MKDNIKRLAIVIAATLVAVGGISTPCLLF